jgi:transposase
MPEPAGLAAIKTWRCDVGRKAKCSEELTHTAEALIAAGTTVREVKAGMSVVLAARVGLKDAVIAEILGVGTATVSRLRNEVRQLDAGGNADRRSWGGRRHQTLGAEEEARFLEPWAAEAEQGGVLVVPPIHAALEERVGHEVAKSTVYRMLARHGWRKIAPDNAHPKRDADAQEAFKKGALRKAWRKP